MVGVSSYLKEEGRVTVGYRVRRGKVRQSWGTTVKCIGPEAREAEDLQVDVIYPHRKNESTLSTVDVSASSVNYTPCI